MKKVQKSTVQFNLRHKAKLNGYSLMCSNHFNLPHRAEKNCFKLIRARFEKMAKNFRQMCSEIARLSLNNRFIYFIKEMNSNFVQIG